MKMYTKYKLVPFCPYHIVRTILSNTIFSVYHFVRTILSGHPLKAILLLSTKNIGIGNIGTRIGNKYRKYRYRQYRRKTNIGRALVISRNRIWKTEERANKS